MQFHIASLENDKIPNKKKKTFQIFSMDSSTSVSSSEVSTSSFFEAVFSSLPTTTSTTPSFVLTSNRRNKFFERKSTFHYKIGEEKISRVFYGGMMVEANWYNHKPYGKCVISYEGSIFSLELDTTTGKYIDEPEIISAIPDKVGEIMRYYTTSLTKSLLGPPIHDTLFHIDRRPDPTLLEQKK